jgi:hypothetical protein
VGKYLEKLSVEEELEVVRSGYDLCPLVDFDIRASNLRVLISEGYLNYPFNLSPA